MKSVFPTLLLLSALGFPALGLAQTSPPPPPPPSKEYFPKAWKPFQDKEGRFSIKFPEPPTESVQNRETSRGKIETHSLGFKGGIVILTLLYTDFPVLPTEQKEQTALLERFRDNLLKTFQSSNPKIIRQSEISLAGNPGSYCHFELDNRQVTRIRVYLVGKRVYQLIVQTRKGSPNEMEGADDFEKIATGFFESFQLTETAPATKPDQPSASPRK